MVDKGNSICRIILLVSRPLSGEDEVFDMSNEIFCENDDVVPAPEARFHCSACRAMTLAPLGQVEVSCRSCGRLIVEDRAFVAVYGLYVQQRLREQRAARSRRSLSRSCSVMGHAEVDALVARTLALKAGHC